MRMFTPFALLAALSMPAVGMAQQPRVSPPQLDNQRIDQQTPEDDALRRTQRREAGFRGTGTNADSLESQSAAQQELVNYLAAKIYLANQCQIELAEMAASQAQSQDIRQLADEIKQAHQQINQKLVAAMPQLKNVQSLSLHNGDSPSHETTESARPERLTDRSATTPRDRVLPNVRDRIARNDRTAPALSNDTASSSGQQSPVDGPAQKLLDIERRAIENNHKLTKQMISDKQGDQFDMCYVGAVIGSHNWMHSELSAIQSIGSPEFTQIVDEADNKVQQHLGTAKQLAEKTQDKLQDEQSGEEPAVDATRPIDPVRN